MGDRRKHSRYEIGGACLIRHEATVGNIIDMSVGGFSCMCLDQENCQRGFTTKINIYCIEKHDIRAEGLLMEVLDTGRVVGQFIENIGLRKCRGKFSQLDNYQVSQLRSIIATAASFK